MMSAVGPKRTSIGCGVMSAIGGKADVEVPSCGTGLTLRVRISVSRREPVGGSERIVSALAPAVEPVPVMLLRPGDEHPRRVVAPALRHPVMREHLVRSRPLAGQRAGLVAKGLDHPANGTGAETPGKCAL